MAVLQVDKLRRYGYYLFQYIFQERLRGLDFTMRDRQLYQETGGSYHGYSKTDEAHLRTIFDSLSYEMERRILDVGCGKGVVLKEAASYPFTEIAGIEIQPKLAHRANQNFRRLGLQKRLTCLEADAVSFEDYGKYDTFFFFNPFSEIILEQVLDKIKDQRKNRVTTVIYHNPLYGKKILEQRNMELKTVLHDSMKNYDTWIMEFGKERLQDESAE